MPDPSQTLLGTPFIELQSVDSTNNYALEQIRAGLTSHGTTFFAHEQVAGKGQRGKTWISERNKSLILTIVIDPSPLPLSRQFQLSACVSVSVQELFQKRTGDEYVRIKWPNDLYWQDKKAGGILIENVVSSQSAVHSRQFTVGSRQSAVDDNALAARSSQLPANNWQWAVVGTGININQTNFPGLPNAVSLNQVTGENYDTVALAKDLCSILDKNLNTLHNRGFDEIYNSYLACLYKKDQSVRFKKGARSFDATVKTVSPEGLLVIQHAIEEEFRMGEIEWVSSEW